MASTSAKEAELAHLLTRDHDDWRSKDSQKHHTRSARQPIRSTVLKFVVTCGLLCGFFLLGRWSHTLQLSLSDAPLAQAQAQGLPSPDLSLAERSALGKLLT